MRWKQWWQRLARFPRRPYAVQADNDEGQLHPSQHRRQSQWIQDNIAHAARHTHRTSVHPTDSIPQFSHLIDDLLMRRLLTE